MNQEAKVGLFANDASVPLEGVRIEAVLRGPCVEVTLTQRYRNVEPVPVEAVYVFPLEEQAAVSGFAARIGDTIVRGRVEERERAFDAYDDAMMDGHGAFLLEQDRPNVFTASVGNLRPGEAVELEIRYVSLARREGDAIRLGIPTTVSPRYVPSSGPEVGQPDGERVNPERWLSVPYGLALRVEVEAGAALRRVESPSHPIRTTLRDGGATVELSQAEVALDRDFVLLVETAQPNRPFAQVAREADGRRVAMVSFFPELSADSGAGHEVIFLLDCSGSMQGESIAQAKRALLLCIRALGEHDTFDVVRFGSSHQALFGKPRRFDDRALEEATRSVQRIDADLGGTEILEPLRELLERPRDLERPRRVLLLTDGQVSNEQQVIALARQHAEHATVFSFGIGAGASEHLVRGVARASRGACEMIFPGERIEPKVLRMFDRVRTPVLDARIDWKGLRVEQAPGRTPPVFAGDALTVLARIESGDAGEVELVAGPHRFAVSLDLERPVGYRDAAGVASLGPIPVLWARERIRELEDDADPRRGSAQSRPGREDRKHAQLVELGTRYGLLSSATSYVAVEERAEADKATQPSALRRVPVALTTGWGGIGARAGGAVMAKSMTLGARAAFGLPSGALPPPSARLPFAAPAPMAAPPPAPRSPGLLARAKRAVFGAPRQEASLGAPAFDAAYSFEAMADRGEPTDRVFDLLMTQKADGRFERSPVLDAWLGSERVGKLAALVAQHGEAAITAVVVALLAREAPERESEWRPAVAKAERWLTKRRLDPAVATAVVG